MASSRILKNTRLELSEGNKSCFKMTPLCTYRKKPVRYDNINGLSIKRYAIISRRRRESCKNPIRAGTQARITYSGLFKTVAKLLHQHPVFLENVCSRVALLFRELSVEIVIRYVLMCLFISQIKKKKMKLKSQHTCL